MDNRSSYCSECPNHRGTSDQNSLSLASTNKELARTPEDHASGVKTLRHGYPLDSFCQWRFAKRTGDNCQ